MVAGQPGDENRLAQQEREETFLNATEEKQTVAETTATAGEQRSSSGDAHLEREANFSRPVASQT